MNDAAEPSDDTAPDLEPAPPAPADSAPAASEAETTQIPAADGGSVTPARPRRRREVVAAGAAGLLVVGGLAGFGIGRATAGDDGPRFARSGQFGPGHHGLGPGGGRQNERFGGGQRGGPPGGQPSGQQDGPPDGPSPAPSPAPDNGSDSGGT